MTPEKEVISIGDALMISLSKNNHQRRSIQVVLFLGYQCRLIRLRMNHPETYEEIRKLADVTIC